MILVHKTTGKPVVKGEELTDFRGDKAVFCSGMKPRHSGSTGRAYVQFIHEEGSLAGEFGYYPSVFDLEWREESQS